MPYGKSNPKRGQESLGKALQRRRQHERLKAAGSTSYDADGSQARGKLTSVLEASNLDDFIASAMMSERSFESHKESAVIIGSDGTEMTLDEHGEMKSAMAPDEVENDVFDFEHMSVPRRPPWTPEMSAEELDLQERKSFLEWRRGIAKAEENNASRKVTPFEKNIEVWRQLWRVVERSDLICQLVDARNPLFYFSTDLETYASELPTPKPMVVIINKADFLSHSQRRDWARHFIERGIEILFFSAKREQARLNREARAERDEAQGVGDEINIAPDEMNSEDESDGDSQAETEDLQGEWGRRVDSSEEDKATQENVLASRSEGGGMEGDEENGCRGDHSSLKSPMHHLLNRSELRRELERLARTLGAGPDPDRNNGRACVGMVGYPNVGKSSVINVLVGATPLSHGGVRVSVGATPGKTKHFQTIVLSDTLMLCDCPGLVFPSFVSSTAEMICGGVLPLMQMRHAMPPITLIARRVPRHILELTYTIKLPVQPGDESDANGKAILTPQQLLESYCRARGLFRPRAQGEVDMPRGARQILKDFTDGRLLFCHPPSGMDDERTDRFLKETERTALRTTKLAAKLAVQLSKVEARANAGRSSMLPAESEALSQPGNVDLMAKVLNSRREAVLGGDGDENEADDQDRKPTRRERGRLKWGKKGRKVGNKDPYGTPDLETAATIGPMGARVAGGGKRGKRGKKRDEFTRVTLPHHQSYDGPA